MSHLKYPLNAERLNKNTYSMQSIHSTKKVWKLQGSEYQVKGRYYNIKINPFPVNATESPRTLFSCFHTRKNGITANLLQEIRMPWILVTGLVIIPSTWDHGILITCRISVPTNLLNLSKKKLIYQKVLNLRPALKNIHISN